MIKHVFLFGVIVPTSVTILFFIGFLVCWFKFNIKERFFKKHFCKWQLKASNGGQAADASIPVKVTYNRNHTHGSQADGYDPHGRDLDPDQQSMAVFPGQPHLRYTLPPADRRKYDFDSELCSSCSLGVDDLESGCSSQNFGSTPDMHIYKEKEPLTPARHITLPPQPSVHAQMMVVGAAEQALIQQTFHFPLTSGHQLKCIPLDGADDPCGGGEDNNYGHFVPTSCVQCRGGPCAEAARRHPAPVQETHFPADKAICITSIEAYSPASDDSHCGSEFSGSDKSGLHLIAASKYHHSHIPNIAN